MGFIESKLGINCATVETAFRFWSLMLVVLFPLISHSQDSAWQNFTTSSSDIPGNHVTDIAFDRNGVAWVGVWGRGLSKYEKGWTNFETRHNKFKTLSINDLEFDKRGRLWLGTDGQGLVSFANGHFSFIPKFSTHETILNIHCAPDGSIWIGTFSEGLFHFKQDEIKQVWQHPEGKKNSVHDILTDQNGDIWFCTVEGIYTLKGDSVIRADIETRGLEQSQGFALEMDSEGNVWVAMLPRGELAKWNGEKWTYYKEPMNTGIPRTKGDPEMLNYGFDFTINEKDQIILAGLQTSPVLRFNGNSWIPLKVPQMLKTERPGLSAIQFDRENNLWLGTWYQGCLKIDKEYEEDIHWQARIETQSTRYTEVQYKTQVSKARIKVLLWDDGKLDGDVVSLKLNGEWVLEKYKLTKGRLELELELKPDALNYLVLHAENLGAIPPNTCAMLLVDGNKRRRFELSSDEQTSGVIQISAP